MIRFKNEPDFLPEDEGKIKVMLDRDAKMPTRAHEADAGYDLYARSAVESSKGRYNAEEAKSAVILGAG